MAQLTRQNNNDYSCNRWHTIDLENFIENDLDLENF